MTAESADIMCVQETKCDTESLPAEVEIPGYKAYWLSGDKDGYSGTGLYTKKEPIKVTYGIGMWYLICARSAWNWSYD